MKKLILTWVVFLLLGSSALASDVASLKLAHTLVFQAVRSVNTKVLEAMLDPEAMGFFRGSHLPVTMTNSQGVPEIAVYLVNDFATLARAELQSEYRVVGTTGIVLSVIQLRSRGSDKVANSRSTVVYHYTGESWKIVSWHSSDVPRTQ